MEGSVESFIGFLAAVSLAGFVLGRMTRMHRVVRGFSLASMVAAVASPFALPLVEPGNGIGLFFVVMAYSVCAPPFLLGAMWGAKRKRSHIGPVRDAGETGVGSRA